MPGSEAWSPERWESDLWAVLQAAVKEMALGENHRAFKYIGRHRWGTVHWGTSKKMWVTELLSQGALLNCCPWTKEIQCWADNAPMYPLLVIYLLIFCRIWVEFSLQILLLYPISGSTSTALGEPLHTPLLQPKEDPRKSLNAILEGLYLWLHRNLKTLQYRLQSIAIPKSLLVILEINSFGYWPLGFWGLLCHLWNPIK